MTTAELSACLNEDDAARIYAKTRANITRRAASLWADGYTLTHDATRQTTDCTGTTHTTDWYEVKTPAGDFYQVALTDTPTDNVWHDLCTCPAFPKYDTCKHLEAVRMLIDEAAAVDAMAAMHDAAEGSYGCDAHARF